VHKLKHKERTLSPLSLSLSLSLSLPLLICLIRYCFALCIRTNVQRTEKRPRTWSGWLVGWLVGWSVGRLVDSVHGGMRRSGECRFGRSVCRSVGWLGYTIFHVITDIKCQKIFALFVAPCSSSRAYPPAPDPPPLPLHFDRLFPSPAFV